MDAPRSTHNERPVPPDSSPREQSEASNLSRSRMAPPLTPRRATEPIPSHLAPAHLSLSASQSGRPRNRSPFSRSHLRSRSLLGPLTPPAMVRAHSMPVVDTGGRIIMSTTVRPSSPLSSPGLNRNPSRRLPDEPFISNKGFTPDLRGQSGGNVSHEKSASSGTPPSSQNASSIPGSNTQFRNRPVSPLRQLPQAPTFGGFSAPAWTNSSPVPSTSKFNEPHPLSGNYPASFSSNSSMPSTPTSCRSRSPSISSLETIPDSPDAEEAALEAERLARLKAAADAAEAAANGRASGDSDPHRRSSLDVPGTGGRAGLVGVGPGFGSRDKRKRWSVCGAERRGDLDLETIWED